MKRFIDSRYGIFMVCMLITILSYIPGVCISGDTEPTPTPTLTPEPTTTACCNEGYHQEPTYADIKVGALGVMTDVEIYGDTCIEYIEGMEYIYQASGGNDKDVCVKDEGTGAYEYDVDEYFTWWGDGHISLQDDSIFYFTPSAPSEPDYCDMSLITAYSNDIGDCNVGDEQKSDSIFVWVWKKFPKWEEDYVIIVVLVQKAGEPGVFFPVAVGCHVWSWYWCENGDITGEEQDVKIEWDGQYSIIIVATHTFEVPNGVSFTSEMTVSGGSPEQGNLELSSYDTHSFAYDYYTSMGGLNSEFYVFVDLTMGGVGGFEDRTVSLSLSAPRCCED
jgi:hypothetical protein